ncbi:MAG: M3 family metallopeptidase, partial [Burkholderiales bacterium]|nr:M3 family metallopeptidase [Burkholderiales bacterium]
MPVENPLTDFSSLPRFADIRPEHVLPAIESLVAQGRDAIEALATGAGDPTWEGFVEPLETANERLARAWSQVSHLNAVVNSPALREAYNAALPRVTQFSTEQAQDLRLYGRFKALAASPGFPQLPPGRRRLVDNELRDFRLGGAELEPAAKARFGKLQEELAALSSRFQDNVLDATNDFALHVTDPAQLSGLPADVIETARQAAARQGREGWSLTLHMPCYLPVMQYADHRPLRSRMYRAHVTRASEFGRPEWDNTPLIAAILDKRAEVASLLGFGSYAGVSLATKMAGSPEEVIAFLDDLGRRARPFAERDMAELVDYARGDLGLDEVHAWDVPWVSEKLRQARYAFSENEVKRYFPEDAVLAGLFRVIETLYGVRVRPAPAQAWHPDVKFFAIEDASGSLVGQFYLDLYAREGKRGGAWMDDARNRRRLAGRLQTPVTFLTCNFSAPVGGEPAFLTHREVITLFHEFGHGLHQLLTRVDDLGVSGLAGVEWDAVELPSQLMENFCWEWDVVSHMSRNGDTGEQLPRALFDKLVAARNFQSGMQFVRQIEFALFDMHLHHDFDRA